MIRGVVQHYVDMISMHIPECIEDLEKVWVDVGGLVGEGVWVGG